MSKPRYDWWPYVKGMIRRYPLLREQYEELRGQSVTANYSGMPRGGGVGRSMESAAIWELPKPRQEEYDAVRKAIEATERMSNGRFRISVISQMYWEGERCVTLEKVAAREHYDGSTVRGYHREFIHLVALFHGRSTIEEYTEAIKSSSQSQKHMLT